MQVQRAGSLVNKDKKAEEATIEIIVNKTHFQNKSKDCEERCRSGLDCHLIFKWL